MLVNTWNGRSYSTAETDALLKNAGFGHTTTIELPSRSLAMVATRNIPYQAVSSLGYGVEHIQPDPTRARWYDRIYTETYLPLYIQLKEINERLGAIGG